MSMTSGVGDDSAIPTSCPIYPFPGIGRPVRTGGPVGPFQHRRSAGSTGGGRRRARGLGVTNHRRGQDVLGDAHRAQRNLHWKLDTVLAPRVQIQTRAHGPDPGFTCIPHPMLAVITTNALRHQKLDLLPQQLLPGIPEQHLSLAVDQHDQPRWSTTTIASGAASTRPATSAASPGEEIEDITPLSKEEQNRTPQISIGNTKTVKSTRHDVGSQPARPCAEPHQKRAVRYKSSRVSLGGSSRQRADHLPGPPAPGTAARHRDRPPRDPGR